MKIFDDLKRELEVIIHHNPEHIRELRLKVGPEVASLKQDAEQLFAAFLESKGLPVGSLAEQAVVAALGVITSAYPGDQPVKEAEPADEPKAEQPSLDNLEDHPSE